MADFHTLGDIQIPRGMVWSDEFDWNPREASSEFSIGGALLLDVAVRLAGQPITLTGDDDAGWIPRSRLIELHALCAEQPDATHLLTLADGRTFDVQFAAGETPITGRSISRPELPAGTHPYVATVRLITV